MGMVEERKDWAANMDRHAKAMYTETSNPHYIVASLAATRIGDFKPSDWALEALLSAVERAWWQSRRDDDDLSLDKALGLRAKRGGNSPRRSAERASLEARLFVLIRTIHKCFDVSIPEACELAYYSIDEVFAEDMDENLWSPGKIYTDEELQKVGMNRETYDAIQQEERLRSHSIIEKREHSADVKRKLMASDWWSITRGERLGYSLDQLIDKYYRVGSKRPVPHGNATEETWLFFDGYRLLSDPVRCTHKVTISEWDHSNGCKEDRIHCQSPIANIHQRPDFKSFMDHVADVRHHPTVPK